MKTFFLVLFLSASAYCIMELGRTVSALPSESPTVAFDSCRLSFIEGRDTVQGRWFRFSDASWDSAITTAPKVSELCVSCE